MDKENSKVVLGLLGTSLDTGKHADRWQAWRPSVSICRQPDLIVKRFELIHSKRETSLANVVAGDIQSVSPETEVRLHEIEFDDAWNFEEVYEKLSSFARKYTFDSDAEDYLIHITTGTHVAQICLFLLTESRHLPGRLLQCSPQRDRSEPGTITIIDLDLSRYDRIASRFRQEEVEGVSYLKGGIETLNPAFNRLIDRVDHVALATRALEEKTFLPFGSDREAHSDFQLIAGTNRDLAAAVKDGAFREDLRCRINLWTFALPGLRQRPEDIEPNLQFELDQHARKTGQ